MQTNDLTQMSYKAARAVLEQQCKVLAAQKRSNHYQSKAWGDFDRETRRLRTEFLNKWLGREQIRGKV